MGFKETLNKYFNNHSETGEEHWDKNLQSKYFKTTKDRAFETIMDYFKNNPNSEIKASSQERGEITVNYKGKRRAFVVVTIIMVKPYRTSVDFSITTEGGLFDLGFSHNLITTLYDDFKKEMEYIN